jgi:peroxiredoxin (alkyl hydroperoxide reductase subunit C)
MRVGKPAPSFSLDAVVGSEFKSVGLKDYEGKWVCLFFYPLDFTFVCPTEILAYNDAAAEFKKLGCEVLAASVDSKFSHLAWTNVDRNKGGISGTTIPLLADINKTLAADYGVLTDGGVALRGLFLIDPKGVIRHATINDLPVGRNPVETLRVLQAFQYHDQHGEVCPANWEPGKATMKPNPTGSQEYFKTVK